MSSALDKFKKIAPNIGWQLDASGISNASIDNFGLISPTSLPTGTGVTVTVDRVSSSGVQTPEKMERLSGVVDSSRIVSCARGIGGTAQAHAGGAVVEIVIDSTLWNDVIDGILAFATQAGKLLISAIDSVRYGADAGATDAYAITLDPVPAAYYAGMMVVFKANTANTGAATLNVNALGAKTIKKNHDQDLADGDIEAGQIVTVIYDGTDFQMQSQTGTTISFATLNAPRGFLINGKIVPSVVSNNLTVAIKTLAGNDPSVIEPVYIRIGDTIRSITAALSGTWNAGTNYCNSGGAELATKEIDRFVYLGWNATDSRVMIGISRIPYGTRLDDFFYLTTTNEKSILLDNSANTAVSDEFENIGRFAATLSGGASYNWSIPTFTAANLIQRPVYETRWLSWAPVLTGFAPTPTATVGYKVVNDSVYYYIQFSGTSNSATFNFTLPFVPATMAAGTFRLPIKVTDNTTHGVNAGILGLNVGATNNTAKIGINLSTAAANAFGGFTASGLKETEGEFFTKI